MLKRLKPVAGRPKYQSPGQPPTSPPAPTRFTDRMNTFLLARETALKKHLFEGCWALVAAVRPLVRVNHHVNPHLGHCLRLPPALRTHLHTEGRFGASRSTQARPHKTMSCSYILRTERWLHRNNLTEHFLAFASVSFSNPRTNLWFLGDVHLVLAFFATFNHLLSHAGYPATQNQLHIEIVVGCGSPLARPETQNLFRKAATHKQNPQCCDRTEAVLTAAKHSHAPGVFLRHLFEGSVSAHVSSSGHRELRELSFRAVTELDETTLLHGVHHNLLVRSCRQKAKSVVYKDVTVT